ncbi:MAG: hypothetical protein PHF25_05495 [Candidatus Margulisbacteria bacterium]|nr:hypothetical protein [Candidatus Margulisiibacteriota bacterium]
MMQNNLSINNIPANIKTYSPSTEQQITKEIKEYFETEKQPVNQESLSQGVKSLLSKQLTVKDFVKNMLNSNSSKTTEDLSTILKSFNVETLSEQIHDLPKQMDKLLNQTQNKMQQDTNIMNNTPKIEITSPEVQIMAANLLGLIKEGKLKEAGATFNNKGDVLEKMLDSFLSQSSQNARETANLMTFIQHVVAQGLVLSPELQKMLEEKYKKLEKQLSFSEELAIEKEEDLDKLSDEAKDYVKEIMDLRQQLEFMDGDTAEEVLSAYEELLELIGVAS